MDPDIKEADQSTAPPERPKPCFIIARPRSGTTVFGKMLQTHPQIVSLGEIFNEANPNSYFNFLQRTVIEKPAALLPSSSNRTFLDYVDSCRTQALERNPKVPGGGARREIRPGSPALRALAEAWRVAAVLLSSARTKMESDRHPSPRSLQAQHLQPGCDPEQHLSQQHP